MVLACAASCSATILSYVVIAFTVSVRVSFSPPREYRDNFKEPSGLSCTFERELAVRLRRIAGEPESNFKESDSILPKVLMPSGRSSPKARIASVRLWVEVVTETPFLLAPTSTYGVSILVST
ncbi:hypothetical protein D9M71_485460 [compost metagenome]